MKPIFWVILFALISPFLIAAGLHAEDLQNHYSEWEIFSAAMKGSTGMNSMGLTAAAVQAIIAFLGTRFIRLPGKYKLLMIQGLTMLTGVTMLRSQGFDWQSSVMHSQTVSAFQVFFHQVLKQFRDDAEPKLELPSLK
jgi:hypothetical protein